MTRSRPGKSDRSRSPLAYVGLGLEIAIPMVLFLLLGHKLDGWLETRPWLTVLGAFVGMSVTFYNLYRRISKPPAGGSGEER